MWVAYFFSLSHHAPDSPSVQLGVLYASKKPITTYIVSVANPMLSIWLIFYW